MRLTLCFLMLAAFAVGCGGGGGAPTPPSNTTEAPKAEEPNVSPPPLPAPQ